MFRELPSQVPTVNHKTLENSDSPEGLEDVRFRLGVEAIETATGDSNLPSLMSRPHHYVSYCVSLYPNPDEGYVQQKIKAYREHKTAYSDFLVAVKRPACC
eukprot:5146750-Amphidinium_carterae.2